jgi:hypothetical protein
MFRFPALLFCEKGQIIILVSCLLTFSMQYLPIGIFDFYRLWRRSLSKSRFPKPRLQDGNYSYIQVFIVARAFIIFCFRLSAILFQCHKSISILPGACGGSCHPSPVSCAQFPLLFPPLCLRPVVSYSSTVLNVRSMRFTFTRFRYTRLFS